MSSNTVYIYGLVCPLENKIMYVGKSYDVKLRFRQHILLAKNGESSVKAHWIRELIDNGLMPTVTIIEACSQDEWQEREHHWIAHYQSVNPNLKNGTPGGSQIDRFRSAMAHRPPTRQACMTEQIDTTGKRGKGKPRVSADSIRVQIVLTVSAEVWADFVRTCKTQETKQAEVVRGLIIEWVEKEKQS